jgi:pimeloyl-ACP methyl ester carboxylesterase
MPYKSLEEYQQKAEFMSYEGHKLAYWVKTKSEASKGTLLFIHGFPSAAWDWHAQWEFFAGEYDMIALDLLGYGLSDKPNPHRYSLLEQADIVEHLCQQQQISHANVIAHDYGNSVAQELLTRQYEKKLCFEIDRLCWLNGGLFPESHRPLLTQKILKSWIGPVVARLMSKQTLQASFNKIFGDKSQPKSHEIETLWWLIEHKKGNLVMPKILDYLRERAEQRDRWVGAMQHFSDTSEVSLSFVNGLQDPISGEHMLKRFRQLLPKSSTTALDVGHYPQLEAADAVNQAIKEFLD